MTKSLHIHDVVARNAVTFPQALAIFDADGIRFDYAGYHKAILHAAENLREHGVQAGDRVMLVAENATVTAVFIFAASVVGAYAVPINARMTASEVDRVIDHSTPRVTVFTTGASPEAATHSTRFDCQSFTTDYGNYAVTVTHPSAPVTDGGDTAVILYTTGTTGTPKGVMLTHGNLMFAGRTSATQRGMIQGDRVYGVLPLTHVFGLASMLMAAACAAATVQLETRFSPAKLYQALCDGVTILPAVPQMHALLMDYTRAQGVERLEGAALRYVSSGAAPLDPTWKRKAEAFYGIALQNGYGMTESTAGICTTRNKMGSPDISTGPALPQVEIKLDVTKGAASETDVGEIMTRGPHVMRGYFRNPQETAKVLDADGFLRTGDLGRIDDTGNLHVVGRCKELIIRGGFNVYPPEVEAALNKHPQIIQSAVIGRTVAGGNEEILGFVQCSDPAALDLGDVRAMLETSLTSYKRPTRIIAVKALPAAATGKILKHRLLDTFRDELAG